MINQLVKCQVNPTHPDHYIGEKKMIDTSHDGSFYLCPACYSEHVERLQAGEKVGARNVLDMDSTLGDIMDLNRKNAVNYTLMRG